MKIHVPYVSNQSIGGGYTFYDNLVKAFNKSIVEWVSEEDSPDILFAFSPTTINGETIDRCKKNGAKFVLRLDGVPEDSRNSGRGTRRLVEYALKADHIIYQSYFIEQTLGRILRQNGVKCPTLIVRNGVDTDTYNTDGTKVNFQGEPKILNIAFRKDPNKRYEEVLGMYREYWTYNKQANLILLGRYPTEWMTYNMGFFNGERYQRLGVIDDPVQKATFIRSCDVMFFPSYADPAPNVVLEAMACGVPVIYNRYGGAAEYIEKAGVAIGSGTYEEIIKQALAIPKEEVRAQAMEHSLARMSSDYLKAFQVSMML